jgi:hypothetical protein
MTVGRISFAPKDSSLWDLLRSEFVPVTSERPPDAITVDEYAASEVLAYKTAESRLEKLVSAGKLRVIWAREPGGRRKRYYMEAPCPTSTRSTNGPTGKAKTRNGGSGIPSSDRKVVR